MPDYEQDILIDETALDVEWLDHASRMFKYCKIAAGARRESDLAAERLNVEKAKLDKAIRNDPEGHGVIAGSRGITEASINAAVLTNPEYEEANRAAIEARYEHEVAQAAVRAFDHRKSALENLVRLHGQSYFAGPSSPRDLSAERTRRDREVQQNIRVRRRT